MKRVGEKTKFLLQNSSEMLATDFEMIKIVILWQNDFLSCMGTEQWHGIFNTYLLLLYSSAVTLHLEDLRAGFTCYFYPFLRFLSLPILASRVWIKRLHDVFPCSAVQQYWGVTFILPAFQSPDWRVGCPFLTALISSDMDGRSRYVAFICLLVASELDLWECCAPS